MKCYLVIAFGLIFVGCVSLTNSEKTLKKNEFADDTFHYVGCPTKLLPVNRAVVMCVPRTFWTESDATVLNSFSKEDWGKIFLLLSRIPTDCIHEKGRMVETAYHIVYGAERTPRGVSVSLFLGEEVMLSRDKNGHWKILNVLTR